MDEIYALKSHFQKKLSEVEKRRMRILDLATRCDRELTIRERYDLMDMDREIRSLSLKLNALEEEERKSNTPIFFRRLLRL